MKTILFGLMLLVASSPLCLSSDAPQVSSSSQRISTPPKLTYAYMLGEWFEEREKTGNCTVTYHSDGTADWTSDEEITWHGIWWINRKGQLLSLSSPYTTGPYYWERERVIPLSWNACKSGTTTRWRVK